MKKTNGTGKRLHCSRAAIVAAVWQWHPLECLYQAEQPPPAHTPAVGAEREEEREERREEGGARREEEVLSLSCYFLQYITHMYNYCNTYVLYTARDFFPTSYGTICLCALYLSELVMEQVLQT